MQTKSITSVDAKQHGASSREQYRMSHGWVTVYKGSNVEQHR